MTQPVKRNNIALAIFSFNRPHYLKEVLASLEKNVGLTDLDFYFFQDGVVNRFSGRIAAKKEEVESCLALWAEAALPSKNLISSEWNKGIAISQWEAKSLLFDCMKYDKVMFFEDDLVLSRYYVKCLKIMLEQFENEPAVGIVMCHGGRPKMFTEQERQLYFNQIRPGNDHLWGWATWRGRWQKVKHDFLDYFNLVKNIDYRQRHGRAGEILGLYKKSGINLKITSQDAGIYYSIARNSLISLQTLVHRARYIGAEGEHMTPKLYSELGYSHIQPLDAPEDEQPGRFEGYDAERFLKYSKSLFQSQPL